MSGDDVDVVCVIEGRSGRGDGMAEGREVGDKVGAAEEGVSDWGDFLEAEDEDIRRGGCRVSKGREEAGREDGGVDGFAATIERYDIRFEGGHCWYVPTKLKQDTA